jgi:hypothetical protein
MNPPANPTIYPHPVKLIEGNNKISKNYTGNFKGPGHTKIFSPVTHRWWRVEYAGHSLIQALT